MCHPHLALLLAWCMILFCFSRQEGARESKAHGFGGLETKAEHTCTQHLSYCRTETKFGTKFLLETKLNIEINLQNSNLLKEVSLTSLYLMTAHAQVPEPVTEIEGNKMFNKGPCDWQTVWSLVQHGMPPTRSWSLRFAWLIKKYVLPAVLQAKAPISCNWFQGIWDKKITYSRVGCGYGSTLAWR